ncbi:MAG: endopeptidase La [Deltaproteobacteria bacterium]|nr:endopeptidase La [Deltaproteobacteria bacterium]
MSDEQTIDSKEEKEDEEITIPEEIPLLPVRDVVVFPFMILPLFVGREVSIRAIDEALSRDRLILLSTQKRVDDEDPAQEDIHTIGTVATIMRMLKLPDGRIKILVQGLTKARISRFLTNRPFFKVVIEKIQEKVLPEVTVEVEALIRNVKEQLESMVSLGKMILPDILIIAENIDDPGRLADLITSNIGLKVDQAQEILELTDAVQRLQKVNEYLNKEIELLSVQQKIQAEAKGEMDKIQREYFLREQLKAIQKELGEVDERAEEINDLREKIEKAKMPAKVLPEAEKQLRRLEKMHPDSAEASTVRTYLEWLIDMPWSKSTRDVLDIAKARTILDEDHYDLEKVKDRILEYLSVRKLKKKMKGPILCFVGPPGVGKTSLGRSIARALGRKFVRISLGGVRDEAEIRGHRRTYVGALPGRVIQGIKQAGTHNPVFMMDEIDKLGSDFRGDPSSALLEVLDPEQNNSFSDHYLNVPFDLSNVMFITTANLLDPIPSALRDRMEVLSLAGYTHEEKLKIARQYLIPRQLEEHGITEKTLSISDPAILDLISHYTLEAGLRNVEREIAGLCRKVARKVAEGKDRKYLITANNLHKYLGPPRYLPEMEMEDNQVGVATGLAWTQSGGDLIFIEATRMRGKGGLVLTGQLGDVMKESAQAAMSFIRSRAHKLGIKESAFAQSDIHVHVPAGAIPKDGPSAGITIATALASVFTDRIIKKSLAMTGEVTLRGRVLPIGGLREKSMAALRAGIQQVIIPRKNEKDLLELPPKVKKNLEFIPVERMDEVLDIALLPAGKGRRKNTAGKTAARSKSAPAKKTVKKKTGPLKKTVVRKKTAGKRSKK